MDNSSGSATRLSHLMAGLPPQLADWGEVGDFNKIWITAIHSDSRRVEPGALFVALVGGEQDGHRFIQDALRRGAAAVVGTADLGGPGVPYLRVRDSRQALAHLAAAFFDYPARKLTMIGVTGTDGKTTTANLIYNILNSAGIRAGLISTVNAIIGDKSHDTGFHVTTPDAPDVQRYLHQMVSSGTSHAIIEATSHGLAQHRVTACDFDIAVVTNITHEHLDYHGSYEAYREAKARLFSSLVDSVEKPMVKQRVAVLNRDDRSFSFLYSRVRALMEEHPAKIRVASYGLEERGPQGADLRAEDVRLHAGGLEFEAVGPDFRAPIRSVLVGEYNVSNCLAAIAAVKFGLGLEISAVQEGIAAMESIPGRMERLDLGTGFMTIVDFAHTPFALQRALETARQLVSPAGRQGRVIAVFGSAGLRDRAKRRMMAENSIRSADMSIFTAEDPRTESLDAILAEMAVGAESQGGVEGRNFWRIADRGEAIRFALTLARPGDAVLALGKGHEQSMCFGEIEYAWDDRLALRAAVSEYLGVPGPEMPALPTSKK